MQVADMRAARLECFDFLWDTPEAVLAEREEATGVRGRRIVMLVVE